VKLYGIKPEEMDAARMKAFLNDNYVSIGYPGIGDPEKAAPETVRERLSQAYGYEGRELERRAEEIRLFVREIRDGDAILVEDGETVHLGDVGDYYYVEEADSREPGTCHRRGVTWIRRMPRAELNELVLNMLDAPGAVKAFGLPWPLAGIDASPSPSGAESASAAPAVDRRTVEEALAILKEAMKSDDPDRRERAAAAILNYARLN